MVEDADHGVSTATRWLASTSSTATCRAQAHQVNTTDDKILSLIECNNEEVKQENSNKNPTVNSVQRDYMAGEVSKDHAPARACCLPMSWTPTTRASSTSTTRTTSRSTCTTATW